MPPRRMHQTTVRFGADLWEALDRECADLGVSIAQFVREAALARLMYAAGQRGDPDFELALAAAVESPPAGSGQVGDEIGRKRDERSAGRRGERSFQLPDPG